MSKKDHYLIIKTSRKNLKPDVMLMTTDYIKAEKEYLKVCQNVAKDYKLMRSQAFNLPKDSPTEAFATFANRDLNVPEIAVCFVKYQKEELL